MQNLLESGSEVYSLTIGADESARRLVSLKRGALGRKPVANLGSAVELAVLSRRIVQILASRKPVVTVFCFRSEESCHSRVFYMAHRSTRAAGFKPALCAYSSLGSES